MVWFSKETANILGAILGVSIGIFAPIIIILSIIFFAKPLARRFIIIGIKIIILCGTVLLGTGIIAVLLKQPYHVFFLFIMLGIITIVVFSTIFRIIKIAFDKCS